MSNEMTSRRRGLAGAAAIAAIAVLGTGCAPDGPDAHLAGEAEPEVAEETPEAAGSETEAGSEAEAETGSEAEEAPAESVAPNGDVVTVLSLDNTFIEEVVEVEPGTEVLWTNNGRNEHNVIPVDPTMEWGVEVEDFEPGDEYSYVFTTPGEYAYFCSIHGTETVGMIGTIIVSV